MPIPKGVRFSLLVDGDPIDLPEVLEKLGKVNGQVIMTLDGAPELLAVVKRTKTRFAVRVEDGSNPLNTYRSWGSYSATGAIDDAYVQLCFRHNRELKEWDRSRWSC